MKTSKISALAALLLGVAMLSGCSSSPDVAVPAAERKDPNASVLFSEDGGSSWRQRIRIDDKKTISAASILSVAVHPNDPAIIYLGTEKHGILLSRDGAQSWEAVDFADKAYGLVLNPQNPQEIYASGVKDKRAKIYKKTGEGEWQEIYTEPSDETTISALAIDPRNGSVLYAGTSEGVIVKTENGGATWKNIGKLDRPVISISFDAKASSRVYFGEFRGKVWVSENAGANLTDISSALYDVSRGASVYTVLADPWFAGTVFVGTDEGIFKSTDSGRTWTALGVIESSKEFPIRAIAVNPQNSKEIVYAAGKAIYKSTDGGVRWSTFQLDTKKDVGVLRYGATDPTKILAGMRDLE